MLVCVQVVVKLHGHKFEIYTFVSEIHDNVDVLLGIENVYEMEGVINTRPSCIHFLNRSIPLFP